METLTVHYPNQEPVELLPAPRSQLKVMRQYFVELQSYWIESVFSVADVASIERCWELMSKIGFMLPQAKNPAVVGLDLEALSNDYEQLETLFFCQGKTIEVEEVHGHSHTVFQATVNTDEFVAAAILNLHRFNPKRILEDAYGLSVERTQAELPKQKAAKQSKAKEL